MFLNLRNQKISIHLITNGNVNTSVFEDHEIYVIEFIRKWLKGHQSFNFQTSGSTGKPKIIQLDRKLLEYSAEQTMEHLNISAGSSLLCIPPQFIGGTMIIVRSLMYDLNLTVQSPSGVPNLEKEYDLLSLVPYQLERILEEEPQHLSRQRNILIGGGAIRPESESRIVSDMPSLAAYHTYGMTETASHIALRKLGQPNFRPLGDTEIQITKDGCLDIRGTLTGNKWMQTNDLVQLTPDGFIWQGRLDFVINSGGLKISPEQVEAEITHQIKHPLIITHLPHEKLGQQVVLLVESEAYDLPDLMVKNKYHQPRKSFFMDSFAYTKNGKIDRKGTRRKLMDQLNATMD